MDRQGTGECKAAQMVKVTVPDLHDSCLHTLRFEMLLGQRRGRNLQGDLGIIGQEPTAREEGSSGADVESSTQLQKFFPLLIHAPNEHWDRNRETLPSPPLRISSCMGHGHAPPIFV